MGYGLAQFEISFSFFLCFSHQLEHEGYRLYCGGGCRNQAACLHHGPKSSLHGSLCRLPPPPPACAAVWTWARFPFFFSFYCYLPLLPSPKIQICLSSSRRNKLTNKNHSSRARVPGLQWRGSTLSISSSGSSSQMAVRRGRSSLCPGGSQPHPSHVGPCPWTPCPRCRQRRRPPRWGTSC